MDSRCSENRESFYVGWWPIKGAILRCDTGIGAVEMLIRGRLKCLSVNTNMVLLKVWFLARLRPVPGTALVDVSWKVGTGDCVGDGHGKGSFC